MLILILSTPLLKKVSLYQKNSWVILIEILRSLYKWAPCSFEFCYTKDLHVHPNYVNSSP